MNSKKQSRRVYLSLLALFYPFEPIEATPVFDDVSALAVATARAHQRSNASFHNYKVTQTAIGIGPQGLELESYFEKDPDTGDLIRVHPAEREKRITAAVTEAGTGLNKEQFADALQVASLGALMFGEELEQRLAGSGLTRTPGAFLLDSGAALGMARDPGNDRGCDTAKLMNDQKYGDDATALSMVGATLSPLAMMSEMTCFLSVGAAIMRTDVEGVNVSSSPLQSAMDEIELAGPTEHNGEPVYVLTIDNLDLSEVNEDGSTMTVNKIQRLIHASYLQAVGKIMTGVLQKDGETRAITLSEWYSDLRKVPGTEMIHPYRTTTTMSGMITEEQQAEMQEYVDQVQDIERQLNAMPPDQRLQMERMMRGQLESLKSMIDDGSFEFTLITKRVVANTAVYDGETAYALDDSKVLVQEIQYDLHALGYEPGNYSGEVTKGTITAIISFQRDYDLALTGEATPELARILSATVGATLLPGGSE